MHRESNSVFSEAITGACIIKGNGCIGCKSRNEIYLRVGKHFASGATGDVDHPHDTVLYLQWHRQYSRRAEKISTGVLLKEPYRKRSRYIGLN